MECIKLVDDVMLGKPIVRCLESKEKFNKLQTFYFRSLIFDTDALNASVFGKSSVESVRLIRD